MQFAMSPTDVLALADAAKRLGGGPFGLAGRVLGFSADEGSKIPAWAWYTVAMMAGATATGWVFRRYGDRIFP